MQLCYAFSQESVLVIILILLSFINSAVRKWFKKWENTHHKILVALVSDSVVP